MSVCALYFDPERHPDRDGLDVKIGARLRELRRSRALSQTELADRLGVTVFEFGRLERGFTRLGAAMLIELAIALEVSPTEFWTTI